MSTGKSTILFCSDSDRLIEHARGELFQSGYQVEWVGSPTSIGEQLVTCSPDLLALDLETVKLEDPQLSEWLKHSRQAWKCQVLLLLRSTSEHRLRELFRAFPTHFLAIDADEHLHPKDLLATVEKIFTPREIFGLGRYLSKDATQRTIRIRRSVEKNDVVEQVAAYARDVGFNVRISQGLAVVADELLTNCLYNAPTDDKGQPRYASLARTVPVELAEHEAVDLTIAYDGKRFGISAVDPFGSLPSMKVVDYLAKCFRRGEDQIDSKEGGAGLGLYKLFTLLQHFVVNIQPGVRTETIGLLEVTRSYREFATRGKSFNLFVASDNESGR